MELQNLGMNWETFFFIGVVLTMIYSNILQALLLIATLVPWFINHNRP